MINSLEGTNSTMAKNLGTETVFLFSLQCSFLKLGERLLTLTMVLLLNMVKIGMLTRVSVIFRLFL